MCYAPAPRNADLRLASLPIFFTHLLFDGDWINDFWSFNSISYFF